MSKDAEQVYKWRSPLKRAPQYPTSGHLPKSKKAEAVLLLHLPEDVPFPTELDSLTPCDARIQNGAWIVVCPFCRFGQVASREDRRFFCCACYNADNGGKWLKVKWPKDAEKIEALADSQPRGAQHWHPIWTLTEYEAVLADPNHTIGP